MSSRMAAQTKMRFVFEGLLALLFLYTGWQALSFRTLSSYLPVTVSLMAFVLMVLGLSIDYVSYRRTGTVARGEVQETAALHGTEEAELERREGEKEEGVVAADGDEGDGDAATVPWEEPAIILRRAGYMLAWTLGYVGAIAVVGIVAASGLFLVSYLLLEAKTGWKLPVLGTILVLVAMSVLKELMNLEWPDYLLESLLF